MGYNTDFKGVLKFAHEVTVSDIRELKGILGEDVRGHDDWPIPEGADFVHVPLCLIDDMDGLEWNQTEKSYGMEHVVPMVVELMRRTNPEFALEGKLQAQGEDAEDRWELLVTPTSCEKRKLVVVGLITCPHCEGRFVPGEE